ncbi:DIMBOA UDP-glucosyltransferase BX9-like [Aegilops tauschii subsp. strangulata]|uniref:Cytokinin-N-glucosyltransferase 2 n=2 Tax=Aegilops tauschii subsp. strangulata TaxID=200361 RepID=A0A453MYQ7_AEGTS|nr:DIMBOA UDP-glucosyltransferase BX9-like [Aegilops tauschii subsp. strangulata]
MAPEEASTATTGGPRRRRVLVFPIPYQGHINPMFQVAGLLQDRGFAVTVFHTHFNAPDPSRHPAYDFVPVPDGLPAGSPGTVAATVEHIFAINGSCEAPFRERLAALLEAPGGRDEVACLVADAHLLTLMDVARQQGVPTLALRTGSAACFRNFMATPMLCDKGYLPVSAESQLDAPVRELPPYRVRDLMAVTSSRHEHDLVCKLLARAVEAVSTSAGFILNTFDALEADDLAATRRDLAGVPVFEVGPLHKISPASSSSLLPQDRSCLDWLDAQAPASVLYISFGSLASMSGEDLAEAAWGVANSRQPFLWALRPGLARGAALPDGFGAETEGRGLVVGWAPQEEVLAHGAVGGFWTHGGWNSALEGACGGVPMLCRPCFGDQMGNARYVEHVWRAGIALDGGVLERGAVERAVRRLMRSEEGEEMRGRARELGSRAAEAIAEGGSSRHSVDKLVNHIMSLWK